MNTEYEILFFDLDSTLYSADSGLFDNVVERILTYLVEELGLPENEIREMRLEYLEKYGTTLGGLRRHHEVDSRHYLDYVHDVPIEEYISPNPRLRKILKSLPYELWIFTNSDKPHADRVLDVLGIADLFSGISDLYAFDFQFKPAPEAYQTTLALAGSPDPKKCMFFDDLEVNLIAAHDFGLQTVLVGGENSHPKIHYHLDHILELPKELPFLWTNAGLKPPGG